MAEKTLHPESALATADLHLDGLEAMACDVEKIKAVMQAAFLKLQEAKDFFSLEGMRSETMADRVTGEVVKAEILLNVANDYLGTIDANLEKIINAGFADRPASVPVGRTLN